MNSNIGKTFNNENTLYTVLEEVIINERIYATLAVKINGIAPNFIIAEELDFNSGTWFEAKHFDTLEKANFEMETHRYIARKTNGDNSSSIQYLKLFHNSIDKVSAEEVIDYLCKDRKIHNELNHMLSLTSLKSGLFKDVTFDELKKLNGYCYKVYVKTRGVSIFEVIAFLCTLVWQNPTLDVNKICKIDTSIFAKAVQIEDYEIIKLIPTT